MTDRMVLTEDEAYELLAHLVASAEICTFEPYYYGSFRLIDAASRLMGHMLGRGDPERDGWLRDLREEIDRDGAFTAERVADEDVRMVVEAARWASSAGNRRINRFLAVRDPGAIARVRAFSPGMLGVPAALVVICTDLERVRVEQVQVERDTSVWVDVGTAAMSMMLAAHALGLGSCPTTSFSRSGVAAALNLPSRAVPEFILQLGHRAHERREIRPGASTKLSLDELLYWERYR